jgi:hypothetical protein
VKFCEAQTLDDAAVSRYAPLVKLLSCHNPDVVCAVARAAWRPHVSYRDWYALTLALIPGSAAPLRDGNGTGENR